MMFQNKLYKILNKTSLDDTSRFSVTIELDDDHEIFMGHFPDNPVLPGVCSLEILKELLTDHTGNSLLLSRASSVKYISMINPRVNKIIIVDITITKSENAKISCSAVLKSHTAIFCRFSGEFKITE
jgi:3-hydroxyacyl-[acyl-carrier-protein] dehydratase